MNIFRSKFQTPILPGEESAGERSLVMVMGGAYLLLAMLILLVVRCTLIGQKAINLASDWSMQLMVDTLF